MKHIYWRPRGLSRIALVLIAVLSLASLAAVEIFQIKVKQPYYKEKMMASRLTREAFEMIKAERIRKKIEIDPDVDPTQSGLVGE